MLSITLMQIIVFNASYTRMTQQSVFWRYLFCMMAESAPPTLAEVFDCHFAMNYSLNYDFTHSPMVSAASQTSLTITWRLYLRLYATPWLGAFVTPWQPDSLAHWHTDTMAPWHLGQRLNVLTYTLHTSLTIHQRLQLWHATLVTIFYRHPRLHMRPKQRFYVSTYDFPASYDLSIATSPATLRHQLRP
jgi:hypothetical protein